MRIELLVFKEGEGREIMENSDEDRKELRKFRFENRCQAQFTTDMGREYLQRQKEEVQQRMRKFGVKTEDCEKEKKRSRMIRFGWKEETKEEVKEKKRLRMERFGCGDKDKEEDEKRRKRMERFGKKI